jgi:hypothetical protein
VDSITSAVAEEAMVMAALPLRLTLVRLEQIGKIQGGREEVLSEFPATFTPFLRAGDSLHALRVIPGQYT